MRLHSSRWIKIVSAALLIWAGGASAPAGSSATGTPDAVPAGGAPLVSVAIR